MHGPFGQVVVRERFTVAPNVVTWLPGEVSVGIATTAQVNAEVVAVAPAASRTVIDTAPNVWGELVIVPVTWPPALTASVAGPLLIV